MLEQVRAHALTDRLLLSQYTFIAKRTEVPNGQPEKARTEVHQIFPAANPDETHRRLLTVNGAPLSEKEIEKQDRPRREQLAERARQLADEAVSERDRRLQDAAEARSDEQELFEDILATFEFRMVRREILDGHPTIIVSFTPRRDAKPRISRGKLFSKAHGYLWVSENDHKVVRFEGETIEDANRVGVDRSLAQGKHRGLSLPQGRRGGLAPGGVTLLVEWESAALPNLQGRNPDRVFRA